MALVYLEVTDAQWLNSWGVDRESTLRYIDYHTILQQILCSSVYHANPFSVTSTLRERQPSDPLSIVYKQSDLTIATIWAIGGQGLFSGISMPYLCMGRVGQLRS